VHAIFCEEVIEHVDLAMGKKLVGECWRILRPGGIFRLTTPDLNWFANRILTEPTAWLETNSIFYDHRHRCIYTPAAPIVRGKRLRQSQRVFL
jgi:predicted SAM-dependent methyltransferase